MKKVFLVSVFAAILAAFTSCENCNNICCIGSEDSIPWRLHLHKGYDENGEMTNADFHLIFFSDEPIEETHYQLYIKVPYWHFSATEISFTDKMFTDVGFGEKVNVEINGTEQIKWVYSIMMKESPITWEKKDEPFSILNAKVTGFVLINGIQYPFALKGEIDNNPQP
jgi:hypothetical protein